MKKKKLNFFCTCNRSESVYYGKFISLLFLNKNFITTYQQNQLFLCVVLKPLSMKYKLEMKCLKKVQFWMFLFLHTHTHTLTQSVFLGLQGDTAWSN